MITRLQLCIDQLRVIPVRVEDLSTSGNKIVEVINTLYDIKKELTEQENAKQKEAEGDVQR